MQHYGEFLEVHQKYWVSILNSNTNIFNCKFFQELHRWNASEIVKKQTVWKSNLNQSETQNSWVKCDVLKGETNLPMRLPNVLLTAVVIYLQQHTLQFSCNKQNICVSKIITQILLILHLVTIVCKTLPVHQSFYRVNKWNIISICWTFKMSIGITRILGKLTFWSLMFLHCIHQECVQISAKRRSITSNGLKRYNSSCTYNIIYMYIVAIFPSQSPLPTLCLGFCCCIFNCSPMSLLE